MEKSVEVLKTEEIMVHFLKTFSLNDEYKLLGDFENFVYEVYKDEEPYILRITHSSHRELEDLYAEIEWVNYLSGHGIQVSTAIQSIQGKYVEFCTAQDQSMFYASLFSKASGEPVNIREVSIRADLFSAWGQTIGQMHKATRKYVPSPLIKKRPQWDEDELLNIEKYFSEEDIVEKENAKELIAQIQGLPKNIENFGLIHSDIHSGNFFFDERGIHVFDFDDCCYHWFVSDIAIPLYYSCLSRFSADQTLEREEFGRSFMQAFLDGYRSVCDLPQNWEQQLPLFLMLRDITLYSVLNKKIDPADLTEWEKGMLKEIRLRINQKKSIVNLNSVPHL
ncbi:phosphotransferase [Bacillus sp. S/N-304-OC-R1]|uniref:phosphotransferase enzyme family protein n=1 Tax=Bacillus sp. S/N-304-OC-R1 TaxID=2758034 RepID=UPI001C8D689E|nr:phosphotransferase [Bacillus sp. S/N-304-OC-R1]MBY0120912.1 phosphotransferase [Bacillus sp. S/N-304-OC-R1]